MKTTRTLAVLLALLLLGFSAAAAQTGAKALFYGASGATVSPHAPPVGPGASRSPQPPASSLATGFSTTPGGTPETASVAAAAGEYMGVQYWVELLRPDGQKWRVTPDTLFRSGDRIRLYVRTNRDGYLTLVNHGSTGRMTVLFPNPATGGSTAITANTDYAVPPASWIRFDDNPGEETLLVMLSPLELSPPRSPVTGPSDAAAPSTAAPSEEVNRFVMTAAAKGAKDLVVETDASGPQPAGYAVAPASALRDGGIITVQIKLRHQ